MDLERGRRSPASSEDHDFVHEMTERNRAHSAVSLLDSMERRTQRTYRYGIGLVCIGATLNWLGFAQGHGYVDPLRYLGVACVISGSFCVCMAMCRWLGRPISVSSHRFQDDDRSRQNGDVHVINVAVPMYSPPMHEEYRPCKPPDYEIVTGVHGEPPPYDEAIKLSPGALFGSSAEQYFPSCTASPSHYPRLVGTGPAPQTEPTPKQSHTPPPPYDLRGQGQDQGQRRPSSSASAMQVATTSSSSSTRAQSPLTGLTPTSLPPLQEPLLPPITLLTTSRSLTDFSTIASSNSTNILFPGPVHRL